MSFVKTYWGASSACAVGVLLGVGVAVLLSAEGTISLQNNCSHQYPLTSPSLDCDYSDNAARLRALDQSFETATAQYIKEGRATRISVWVRDLESKQWAASNERATYAPASLLKLPLMIAYYKLSEIEPALLTTELPYTATENFDDTNQNFKPAATLVVGQSYTVEQLLEDMVVNSDNNAAVSLLSHLDPTLFNNTLIDLGIKIPQATGTIDFITVKSYANIFRILYNASYINRDNSQKALALMSKSVFKGIAEPLPASATVADKFGEREVDNQDGSVRTRELHDCGIVYGKGVNPYTICIMTEGKNFDDLLSVIHDLSKLTYQMLD